MLEPGLNKSCLFTSNLPVKFTTEDLCPSVVQQFNVTETELFCLYQPKKLLTSQMPETNSKDHGIFNYITYSSVKTAVKVIDQCCYSACTYVFNILLSIWPNLAILLLLFSYLVPRGIPMDDMGDVGVTSGGISLRPWPSQPLLSQVAKGTPKNSTAEKTTKGSVATSDHSA
eukprot:m.24958 g.24958  ORF g.24958 m.24958 type:complete len:172 (+) comp28706_c0_seq1:317-832(+)